MIVFGKRTHFYMLAGEVFFKEADLVTLGVRTMRMQDVSFQSPLPTYSLLSTILAVIEIRKLVTQCACHPEC